MASAQVLKKQEHLEAGKRKLLEFRRKKAAEKAKKAISTTQLHASDGVLLENQSSEADHVRLTDSNGVGTSDALAEDRLEPSVIVANTSKGSDITLKSEFSSYIDTNAKPSLSASNNDVNSYVLKHPYFNSEDSKDTAAYAGLDGSGSVSDKSHNIKDDDGLSAQAASGIDTNAKPSLSASNNDVNSYVLKHPYFNSEDYKDTAAYAGLDGSGSVSDKSYNIKDDDGLSAQAASGVGNIQVFSNHMSSIQENYASSHSSYHGSEFYPSNNSDGFDKNLSLGSSSSVFTTDIFPKSSGSAFLPDKLGNSSHGDNSITSSPFPESLHSSTSTTNSAFGIGQKFTAFSDMGEKKISGSVGYLGSMNHSSPWTSDNRYTDYNSDARSSSDHAPQSPPAAGRRNRPSFLDTIQISKGHSSSPPLFGAANADSSSSKVYPMDGLGLSVSHRSTNSSLGTGDGAGLFNHVVENKHDFFPQKPNEDFAALEQHIEDLTQEKFSLQRALEASRALAESLASENSTLTDSFNQQGSVVNQLKFELERLQEEIKAQMVELEAVRIEYVNAQMECHAADERAKLLASEVIGLEEKALRLRSNELKLERQLENAQAEISSYRKKMSSLEKDRQDLQSTIDALQEEKKLLQSKLRKASASGKSLDVKKTSHTKTDVSTSTEDLDVNTRQESSNSENLASASLGDDTPGSLPHENILLSIEGLPITFPPEQIKMIDNINTLMAELALEKDQLTQALSAESSQSSQLLELNKELTRKLEAQTQRLELLTAQSMANDNIQPRQMDPRTVHDNPTYADEGDEVVERVLGWIMKLFPGGPSRRRTSKHL